VWREPTPDASSCRDAAELAADGGGRPGPAAGAAVDDAEQRPDRQLRPRGEPGAQLLPAPLVHADLAPPAALAAADQQRSASRVEVVLGKSERLLEPQPGTPQQDDHRAQREAVTVIAGRRMTATISSKIGGSAE
jgi:hypothetical protein